MAVRALTPTDLDRVLELNQGALPAVGTLDRPGLDALVDRCSLALAVTAPDSDALGGFCLILSPGSDYASVNYRWFSERYEDFTYLDRVVIDPSWRGHGLGRELYEHVEASTDAAWFLLEVNLRPRNDESLAFHDRLGFAEVGQLETDYGALVSMQGKRLR